MYLNIYLYIRITFTYRSISQCLFIESCLLISVINYFNLIYMLLIDSILKYFFLFRYIILNLYHKLNNYTCVSAFFKQILKYNMNSQMRFLNISVFQEYFNGS